MKKALVVSSEWGLNHGGAEEWAYYIKKKLENDMYKCHVWAVKKDGIFVGLFKSFSTLNFDVVIAMDWRFLALMPALLIMSRFKKLKILCIFHGNEIFNINYSKIILIKLIKMIGNIKFYANSNNTKKLAESIIGEGCVDVIHPFSDYIGKNRVEKKNKDEIIFVTISRLVERKNHMETIKALDIYRKKYNKKIKYHIVGDGEYKDAIFNFIKNKNFEFVEMHGRLNKDEKNSLFYTFYD